MKAARKTHARLNSVGDATAAGKWLSMAAGVQETKRKVLPAVVLHGSKLWTSGESPEEAREMAGTAEKLSTALGF